MVFPVFVKAVYENQANEFVSLFGLRFVAGVACDLEVVIFVTA